MDMVELYVIIDNFCKKFMPQLNKLLKNKNSNMRNRTGMISISEIVLILILFPHSEFKCFKWFYINKICGEYRSYFRQLPSYNRFVELMPKGILTLSRLLNRLLALTIEPFGLPTADRIELVSQINKLSIIKKALVRKLKPKCYYFQAEFNHDRNFGDDRLLAPHCHGVFAVSSNKNRFDEAAEYINIKEHTIHIQPIYDLKIWVAYTLKQLAHPTQLANSRIKLFTKSKGLW